MDFGISGLVTDFNKDYINAGSLRYMAPELFDTENKKIKITYGVDIWAIGCILYRYNIHHKNSFLLLFNIEFF